MPLSVVLPPSLTLDDVTAVRLILLPPAFVSRLHDAEGLWTPLRYAMADARLSRAPHVVPSARDLALWAWVRWGGSTVKDGQLNIALRSTISSEFPIDPTTTLEQIRQTMADAGLSDLHRALTFGITNPGALLHRIVSNGPIFITVADDGPGTRMAVTASQIYEAVSILGRKDPVPLYPKLVSAEESVYSEDTMVAVVRETARDIRTRIKSLVKGIFDERIKLCETRSAEYQEQVARHAEAGRYDAARFDAADRDKYSDRGAYLDTFLSDVLRKIDALPALGTDATEPAP